jgi:hypothetical protein
MIFAHCFVRQLLFDKLLRPKKLLWPMLDITIMRARVVAIPAFSVELFRYRGAAKDGGTLEYADKRSKMRKISPSSHENNRPRERISQNVLTGFDDLSRLILSP